MSNDQDDIKDIIAQLQQLQIQQSLLLQRLERLNEGDSKKKSTQQRVATVRDFAIGDQVRIKNPNYLQPNSGKISKINPKRITVVAPNGTTIVRAPKNRILIGKNHG